MNTNFDTFQRRHFRQIRLAYRIINVLNLVTAVVLLVLLKADLIKVRYFYLIVAILPMDIYLFSWIFHKVVIWKDPGKTRLPKDYICLGLHSPVFVLILFDALFVLGPMLCNFQCIRGEKTMLWSILVLFAVLSFLSLFFFIRQNRKNMRKIEPYIIIAMISISYSWILTSAVYYTASRPPVFYPAVVESTSQGRHRDGTSYYIMVFLRDGSRHRLLATENTHKYAENHTVVLICERDSLFGTQFVSVHESPFSSPNI